MDNKIKMFRIKAGLTQPALSSLSGINIRQIQKYESNDCNLGNMTIKNAIAICRALNCHVEDLLQENGDI